MKLEKPFMAFKDSTLIVAVLFRNNDAVEYSITNILKIITNRPNTFLVLINNAGELAVSSFFKSISHDQCLKFDLPFNFGKALAANFFFKEYITEANLPKTVVSLDPDTVFSKQSFNALVEASEALPQCGMLGMRYADNGCNPERNLFFKPKKIKGNNNRVYRLSSPFMCTVAGPVLAISGEKIWKDCKNELFPKRYIKVYGGDDSALYNAVRWKYINGYLEDTEATHLVSGAKRCSSIKDKPFLK